MKFKKKQLSKIISDKNKIFACLVVFVTIFVVGLTFIGKGTYSVEEDNNVDSLSITCPETVRKGGEIECSITLNSVTMSAQGISAKYAVSEGLQFVEFISDTWDVYTSDEDGFVLVNLDGVTGENIVGTVKYSVPADAVDNEIYKIELVDATIGDGAEGSKTFENVYDEVRILSDINTLDEITLSSGTLNESFDKDVNDYTANIDNDKITIKVDVTDENSKVTGDVGEVNLHYGTNELNIVVTSETGIENTYTISIYRKYQFVSSVYEYNEEHNYMYTFVDVDNEVILGKLDIPTELSRKIDNNKLIISYEEELLKEINLVNISSSKYDLNKDYIYIGTNQIDLNDINIVNAIPEIDGNTLKIVVDDTEIVDEFSILSISFGDLDVDNKVINLDDTITYDEFIGLITISDGMSVEIFNNGEEVTSGDLTNDMMVRVYYNDILLDEYEISDFEFELSSDLDVDTENNYINYLKEGTTISEFLENVTVRGGNVAIYDSNEYTNKKNDDDVIATGDVLVVSVNNDIKYEYTLSVIGDANGDGKLNMLDIVLLRRHYVGWVDPNTNEVLKRTGVYLNALDMNKDGIINMIDIVLMRRTYVGLI